MIKQNDTDNTAISKKQTEEENHTLEFFMPMDPPTATHQLKQVRVMGGKPIFYEPAKVKDARAKLLSHLVKNAPETPFCGPVSLCVKWCFPAKSHKPGTWRDTKPDTDNLQKLLKDCMTESGFWNDDAQVVQEIIEKFWWDTPGIYICIRSLAQNDNS